MLAIGALLSPLGTQAADTKKPVARYWMSVATENRSMPGMGEAASGGGGLMGGLIGGLVGNSMGMSGVQKSLILQLNSPLSLPSDPQARHDIPRAMNMGDNLPLIPAQKEVYKSSTEQYSNPEQAEKPKGRILIYWGCDENVPAGQPRILDAARMSPAEFGRGMMGRHGSGPQPPSPGSAAAYADWPNKVDDKRVPSDASLLGDHFIHGNFSPDIRLGIGRQQDFMAPVEFDGVKGDTSASVLLRWKAIPTSIGYFVMATGSDGKGGDTIIWTSSRQPDTGWGLMDYLPTPDVQRFIKEKVVLPADTTECAIPKGIFGASQGAMVQMIAYGEDLNTVWPPKPKTPDAAVKVRLKSTGMLMLAGREERGGGGSSSDTSGGRRSYSSQPREKSEADKTLDAVKKIKGLFSF